MMRFYALPRSDGDALERELKTNFGSPKWRNYAIYGQKRQKSVSN